MRKTIAAVFVAALMFAPVSSYAQALIDGQVTKVDEPAGKLTIKHGPLPKFDMNEPMTMVFRAQDPAMLKTVKAGDKIKFDTEKINGQFTVIKLEKAGKK